MLRSSALGILPCLGPTLTAIESAAFSLVSARLASAIPSPAYVEPIQEPAKTFRARDLDFQLVPTKPQITNLETVKFGTLFTDHMFAVDHSEGQGWSRPIIRPFGYLQLHPAAQVLHYGMGCFEGMKAYKGPDGRPRLFRPEMNMARLHRSAQRLMLADFDPNELLECIKHLIRVDRDWLPSKYGHSLYIRPFIYSSANFLGVSRTNQTSINVILSPVGPYFPTGPKPISLFVEESTPRAWPGGVGSYKVGGNYAPTILPQVKAAARYGAQQVVYTERTLASLQDPELAHFDECGAMNIFFLLETSSPSGSGKKLELITPPLDGTILPGVTRDSILSLAREWGEVRVSERTLTIKEVKQAALEGRLVEAFGSGTACIVQPVAAFVRANGDVYSTRTDASKPGSFTGRVQSALMDIQYGLVPHAWSVPIDG